MTTRNLIGWIALFGAAEGMLQAHLANHAQAFFGAALVLAGALGWGAWRLRARRGAAIAVAALAVVPVAFAALEGAGVFGEPPPKTNAIAERWDAYPREVGLLREGVDTADAPAIQLFQRRVDLAPEGWRRDPRLDETAADRFRIVALGGSSTFGATSDPAAPPWPALLERAIAERLRCATPVEVVNGGVLGRGIQQTLASLPDDLARLRPALLLYLPAVQDLAAIVRSQPELGLAPVETVPPRVSQLWRRLEVRATTGTAAEVFAAIAAEDRSDLDLRASPLGQAYRRLLVEVRAQGLDLALLPIPLAIDAASRPEAVARFEAVEPRTRRFVLARPLHERLLRQLGAAYRAPVLDAAASIDGGGESYFQSLSLLDDAGRRRFAEAVLATLEPRLARTPRPGCVSSGESG